MFQPQGGRHCLYVWTWWYSWHLFTKHHNLWIEQNIYDLSGSYDIPQSRIDILPSSEDQLISASLFQIIWLFSQQLCSSICTQGIMCSSLLSRLFVCNYFSQQNFFKKDQIIAVNLNISRRILLNLFFTPGFSPYMSLQRSVSCSPWISSSSTASSQDFNF